MHLYWQSFNCAIAQRPAAARLTEQLYHSTYDSTAAVAHIVVGPFRLPLRIHNCFCCRAPLRLSPKPKHWSNEWCASLKSARQFFSSPACALMSQNTSKLCARHTSNPSPAPPLSVSVRVCVMCYNLAYLHLSRSAARMRKKKRDFELSFARDSLKKPYTTPHNHQPLFLPFITTSLPLAVSVLTN